ncbi:hypothetical protein EU514_15805 [Pseudomonas fragi]|nr:hypothetical protein [Pseudomonas fragi]
MLEVLQVIKRVFEGIGNHGQNGPLALNTGYAYRYQLARHSGKSYWMSGLQAGSPSGWLTGLLNAGINPSVPSARVSCPDRVPTGWRSTNRIA